MSLYRKHMFVLAVTSYALKNLHCNASLFLAEFSAKSAVLPSAFHKNLRWPIFWSYSGKWNFIKRLSSSEKIIIMYSHSFLIYRQKKFLGFILYPSNCFKLPQWHVFSENWIDRNIAYEKDDIYVKVFPFLKNLQ